jgi:hypothetical protein
MVGPETAHGGWQLELVHLTQYYRDIEQEEHVQLSGLQRSTGLEGPKYQVERHRYRDAEMEEILKSEVVAPESPEVPLDGAQVRSKFFEELSKLIKPRFVLGTRHVVFRGFYAPKASGAEPSAGSKVAQDVVIELTGGLVSAYTTATVSCELVTTADQTALEPTQTLCSCF